MSSILKALKKLESAPASDTPAQPWLRSVGNKKIYPPRLRRTWQYKGMVGLLIAAGVPVMIGWYIVGRNPFPDDKVSPNGSVSGKPAGRSKHGAVNSAVKPGTNRSNRSVKAPTRIQHETKKSMVPVTGPGFKPKPQPIIEKTSPQSSPLSNEKGSLETDLAQPVLPKKNAMTPEPEAPFIAERTDDDRLALQAIA